MVGIGTGSTQDNPYYASGGSLPPLGYSNSTVQQFVNSAFFARDLNQTGYLPSGAVDPLWASYKGIGNSISLSSGNYVNPTTFHLYGNQSYAQMLAMRFYIPQSEQSIQLQWYGSIVGSPSDLKTLIYADRGGTFSASQTPISVENESSSGVSQKAGWTGPIQYTGPFSPGFYWVVFEASTNDSNYYNMYTENQATTNSSAVSIYSFSNFSLGGPQSSAGSSILWVKNAKGTSLSI